MGNDDNLVPAPESGEVSSQETPPAGPVSQGETPSKSATDVEKRVLELSQKYERDIANMKSSFQKSEFEMKKQLEEQRNQYDKHVRELRVSRMDEEERKRFESEELLERNKNFEAEAIRANQKLEELKQMEQYKNFFSSVGIPTSSLSSAEDLTSLVNLGYSLWAQKTKQLEQRVQEMEKKSQKSEDEEETPAPEVNTTKGSPPKGTTWADLIKRYGSAENVYRQIELGHLDPSILPK